MIMKKIIKKLLIIFITVLFLYAIYIVEENIRLKNGGRNPLIIVGKDSHCDGDKMEHLEKKYKTDCKGIGYRIKREYILDEKSSEDNRIYIKIKEEFWLFDKYLLWGWIS